MSDAQRLRVMVLPSPGNLPGHRVRSPKCGEGPGSALFVAGRRTSGTCCARRNRVLPIIRVRR